MCVMDIRPGDSTQEMAQAMAHNTSSVQRDAEMVIPILESRGDGRTAHEIQIAAAFLREAYEIMQKAFGDSFTPGPTRNSAFHQEIGLAR